MLYKCRWIMLYTVHFTAFCLGGPFFPGHGILWKQCETEVCRLSNHMCYECCDQDTRCHD